MESTPSAPQAHGRAVWDPVCVCLGMLRAEHGGMGLMGTAQPNSQRHEKLQGKAARCGKEQGWKPTTMGRAPAPRATGHKAQGPKAGGTSTRHTITQIPLLTAKSCSCISSLRPWTALPTTSLIPNAPTHCIPHPNPPHALHPSDGSAKRCCSQQPQDQPMLKVNGTQTLGQRPPIKITPPTSLLQPASWQLPSSCSKSSDGFHCFTPPHHKSPLSEHFCPPLFVLVFFHCSQSHPSGSGNASALGSPHTHSVCEHHVSPSLGSSLRS